MKANAQAPKFIKSSQCMRVYVYARSAGVIMPNGWCDDLEAIMPYMFPTAYWNRTNRISGVAMSL